MEQEAVTQLKGQLRGELIEPTDPRYDEARKVYNAMISRKPRLIDSLPARIWGIDSEGEFLSLDSQLENISSSGLFLRASQELRISSQVSLVVRLINGSGVMAAIRGKVLRDEPLLDGSRGIAVKITEHCFL